jgi:TonB family protein
MWLSILALSAALTAAPPPPYPPIMTSQRLQQEHALATWSAGEVRCDGSVVIAGDRIRRPFSVLTYPGAAQRPPMTLSFDIDASGRPVSIKAANRYAFNDDVAPALAASRFPAVAHCGCSVNFSADIRPMSTAFPADLVAYTMMATSGPLPPEGWKRIRQDGTCGDRPRPQPRLRAYPDFASIAATPGAKDWSLVAYDIDAGGKPVAVRMALGTGNKALDAEAVKAVRKSRFSGGARNACLYPYWRAPATLPAPAMPQEGPRPANATCSADRKWVRKPELQFPVAYGRRRIEGWAVVSFDTAPWGAVGNVQVLGAQPSDDFGRQAAQMIERATVAPSPQGSTGCIERVRFVMPGEDKAQYGEGAQDEPAPEPAY